MKYILFILPILSFNSFAQTRYECETPVQSNRIIYSQGSLVFTIAKENGKRVLSNVLAEVRADWSPLQDDQSPYEYRGEFSIDRLVEKENYNPRVYLNHSKFENFDASNNYMWGDLIVEKAIGAKSMNVHYIFQAGDHIGGVIDFKCSRVD